MTTITAAIAREVGAPLSLEQLELEGPRPDEALVRIVAVGICHTDVNYRNRVYEIDFPIVLGHEGAGVVQAIGEQAEGVAVGDHVVLTYGTCGHCAPCRSGNPAYCVEVYALNLRGNRADGSSALDKGIGSHFFGQSSFATHAVVPVRNLVKVPADAPLELLGPLGCGVQTGAGAVLRSLGVPAGRSLAVFGAGAVGLSAVMAGVIAGADPIVAVDKAPSRLALAAELGATVTIDANAEDPVERIRSLTSGGVDFTIEAAGATTALRQAIDALGPLGVCAIVGGVSPGVEDTFSRERVQMNGITIRGVVEGDSVPEDFIPELVELQRRRRFPLEKLVTFYEFADINKAIEDADGGGVVKPILRMPSVR